MNDRTEFTQYMHTLIGSVMDKIKTFYCREDLEAKLREVLRQYEAKRSGYAFRLKELDEMCRACGMDADLLLDEQTRSAALARVPRRKELRKKLLLELHRIFLEFPASSEYIARLVRRLSGPSAEPVRLTILKRFLLHTDYHTAPVEKLAEAQLTATEKAQYKTLAGQAAREFLVRHVDDRIFRVLDNPADGLNAQAIAQLLEKQLRLDPEHAFQPSEAVLSQVQDLLGAALPENNAALFRLLGARGDEAGGILDAIEQEYCAFLKPAGKDKAYRQAKKDAKKARKTDWTLLKLADDLAGGKFRVNGITREQLYVFAIAFDMRYYPDPSAPGYDPGLDVVKNLFQDYYSDNLLRSVLDEEYLHNKTFYEAEPTGEGINYKNFVEIIYLYYLCRTDLTAAEKLRRAQLVTDKAVKAAKNHPDRVFITPSEYTAAFREHFLHTLMDIRDEDALVEYLCTHYYIYNPTYSGVRMQFASQQNTALQVYRTLARNFMNQYPESFGTMYDRVELNNGLDVPALLEQLTRENPDDPAFLRLLDPGSPFVALLTSLDKKLRTQKTRICKLCAEDDTEFTCTRTELITLYYCYFLNVLQELVEDYGIMDLPQLYEEFCHGDGIRPGIDQHLLLCRYQPISEKNAYDMFVIFALFLELIRWDV